MRVASLMAASLLLALPLSAQGERMTVQVIDSLAQPIPFAWVQLTGGVIRVADDSGRAVFNSPPRDSLQLQVRRMGFLPFTGWLPRTAAGNYLVTLAPAPRALAVSRIEERRNTPLARAGFYDRLDRAQNSATVARFITPEELDFRNPAKLTQVLMGEQTIRVRFFNQRALLEGRGSRCGLAVVLDGRLMTGMLEELVNVDLNPALRRDLERATSAAAQDSVRRIHAGTMTSVDELINAGSVAAVEIYPSPASVPAELQRLAGSQSCGVVAIWSGGRR